jgi:NAD+ kinase
VSTPLETIAVMATPGRQEVVAAASQRVEEAAAAAGVGIGDPEDPDLDLLVVLGGDGTMLRALRATLGTETPVFGINFGRVGFLTTADGAELDSALARALAGDFRVVELCTLEAGFDGVTHAAVNDVVVTSSQPGRMVELGWQVAGEDLGNQPCDGMICCTPSGSTAYNLSNGGPVLMWGIDAMALTFVAPHSLHVRPLVVPRNRDVLVWNRTGNVPVAVLADGHQVAEVAPGKRIDIRLARERSLLATLPEATFVHRYRQSFTIQPDLPRS